MLLFYREAQILLLAHYHIFSFGTLETLGARSDCSTMSSAPKRLVADPITCGKPICGICNSEFGNENIIWCSFHSSEKENIREDNVNVGEGKQDKKRSKVLGKGTCAAEYSSKDLLILSQAYICTSENAIEGVSQKKKLVLG